MQDYFSIHNHTECSNFRGNDCIIRIPDLIDRSVELGYKGVCITDHEAVSGHVKFLEHYQFLKKSKEKLNKCSNAEEKEKLFSSDKDMGKNRKIIETFPDDFKIGLGNEIYLVNSLEEVKDNYVSGVTKFWHFILVAKDRIGYQQLKEISSKSAWTNYYRYGKIERVPTIKDELKKIIGENKGHLIASSACLGSELAQWCLAYFRDGDAHAKTFIHNFITWCIDIFGKENFFLELQPNFSELQENLIETHPQIIVNQALVKLAKAYDLDCVVTTDSHYLKKEHRSIHEAYLKSDENERDRELGEFYANTYLMDETELIDGLKTHLSEEQIKSVFYGTKKVYDLVEDYDLHEDVEVPEDKKVPDDFTIKNLFLKYYEKYEYIKKFSSGSKWNRYLLFLIENGFVSKNQDMNDETNIARINTELETLWLISEQMQQDLSKYYILVRNIIQEIMWKLSYVGPARGSVTGSYFAYLIDITQVNPITEGLHFWRHLHQSRPELPDIDVDTERGQRQAIVQEMRRYFGSDNVLNTLTLQTEGTRSTVLTSCRGLGIDNDVSMAISDLIPFERGSSWSLKECFEGDEEKGRAKLTEFINEVNKYPNLKETMLMIEGLISGRSIHASSVYIFSDGYLKNNSLMRAPKGELITAYNMTDSDKMGALKFDALTVSALDKIHKTVDLLVEAGVIEDQGSIKATYDKYLYPDTLDYSSKEMWDLLGQNKLIDAFQFETQMGSQATKKIKPSNLDELATANSVMRLMADDGAIQPIDLYVLYKDNIKRWYDEMNQWGLNKKEISILEKYLLNSYGIAVEQEIVMLLSMDENISNFTVAEANKLRKAIAKKKASVLEQVKELFFKKGKEAGAREVFLDYVWNVQFKKSFGYSFSRNHTVPYSIICIQEMNLAYKWGILFWNTAVLSVNASADENSAVDKATDYGKIAKAIGSIQSQGQRVELPDINKAHFGFFPDKETDSIVFGLKGIIGINNDNAKFIIENRPYTSFWDFYKKIQKSKEEKKVKKKNGEEVDGKDIGDSVVISLIKAGMFDNIEKEKTRTDLLKEFIYTISKPLKNLTMSNIILLNQYNLLTESQKNNELRFVKFKKYVTSPQFFYKQDGKGQSTAFYKLEHKFSEPFFLDSFEGNMVMEKDYTYTEDGYIAVKVGALDREIDKKLIDFKRDVLSSSDYLKKVNKIRFQEKWKEYEYETLSKWEMDSVSFYFHKHELSDIDEEKYKVVNFFKLPEKGEIVDTYMYRGKEKPRFQLQRIAGTVLDKNKNKHIVTLLTKYGVVNVKFYKGQFVFYDKQVSTVDSNGDKTVQDKSWFTRGNKLLVTGFRREDQFVPKRYSDSAFQHSLQLIEKIDDKELVLRTERFGIEND